VLCSLIIRQHSSNTLILLIAAVQGSYQYGAEWSVIWLVMQDTPLASAMPPPRDTVYVADLRLGK